MGEKGEPEQVNWWGYAEEKQKDFNKTIGLKGNPYDEIEKSNLFLLRKKIGYASCGKPNELPSSSNFYTGYKKEYLEQITNVCIKIIEKSDYDPICFACTLLILHYNGEIGETAVFRIITKSGSIFIDVNARVYQNWEHFMKNNKLPACDYCYPMGGEYSGEDDLQVFVASSPANSLLSKGADYLDTAGTIASLSAASVLAASSVVAITPVAIAAAGVATTCTAVYSVSRGANSLYDRKKHEQSIGLGDRESRSAWLSVASSAVCFASTSAIVKAKKLVESGKSLSRLGIVGLHALNATSLIFSGYGFVDSLFLCADNYKKGILTKKDIFDLSCELLFLFNALASARATSNLVNNMVVIANEAPIQKKLTKTQKRNLRKRNAKRRAKGFVQTNLNENTQTNGPKYSMTIKLLIIEALRAFHPRVEEILITCQSIGHDIMRLKAKDISITDFFKIVTKNLVQLYNRHQEEISEALTKISKYFISLGFDQGKQYLIEWFQNCSEELQSIFCIKVINMEDQIDIVIDEADKEIQLLHEQLGFDENDGVTDESQCDSESVDELKLNSEAQSLLSACKDIIGVSPFICNDLEDFGDILEVIKNIFIKEFSKKIANYKKSLEAAKAASENAFNIDKFYSGMGLTGDVVQHFFKETLHDLNEDHSTVYKIKTKLKEIERQNKAKTTPVWEGLTEGVFHYYGGHGAGNLPKSELLTIVSEVLKIEVNDENCTYLENEDVVFIQVKDKCDVVVFCGITKDNTANGFILTCNNEK